MPIYKTKLKSKREIAAGTMAFHLEKPAGFVFKAGQFGASRTQSSCGLDRSTGTHISMRRRYSIPLWRRDAIHGFFLPVNSPARKATLRMLHQDWWRA